MRFGDRGESVGGQGCGAPCLVDTGESGTGVKPAFHRSDSGDRPCIEGKSCVRRGEFVETDKRAGEFRKEGKWCLGCELGETKSRRANAQERVGGGRSARDGGGIGDGKSEQCSRSVGLRIDRHRCMAKVAAIPDRGNDKLQGPREKRAPAHDMQNIFAVGLLPMGVSALRERNGSPGRLGGRCERFQSRVFRKKNRHGAKGITNLLEIERKIFYETPVHVGNLNMRQRRESGTVRI